MNIIPDKYARNNAVGAGPCACPDNEKLDHNKSMV
jgi:hypothetical protein